MDPTLVSMQQGPQQFPVVLGCFHAQVFCDTEPYSVQNLLVGFWLILEGQQDKGHGDTEWREQEVLAVPLFWQLFVQAQGKFTVAGEGGRWPREGWY